MNTYIGCTVWCKMKPYQKYYGWTCLCLTHIFEIQNQHWKPSLHLPQIHFLIKYYLLSYCVLGESELTGSVNLMAYYGLEHTYSKFSGKRLKESLSSFLPNLPGIIDTPGHNDQR